VAEAKPVVFEFPADPDSSMRHEFAAAAAEKAAEAVKLVSPASNITVENNVLTVIPRRDVVVIDRTLVMKMAKAADAYHFVINGALKRLTVDGTLPEGEYDPVVRRATLLSQLAQAMGESLDIFLVIDEDGEIRFTDFVEYVQNHGAKNVRDWAIEFWHSTRGNAESAYANGVIKALETLGLPADERLRYTPNPLGKATREELIGVFISSGQKLLEKGDHKNAYDAFFVAFQLERWGFLR
jgi:hypothetical protein